MAAVITDGNFQTEVLDNNKVTVLDMWAEWCGPCKAMNPVIEQLAEQYEGRAVIAKMNVDDNSETPFKYNVRGIPTFLLFKNGQLADKIVGATTKQNLETAINKLLA